MSKFTPWFPPKVRPARAGMYQVKIRGNLRWARWGKGQWHLALPKFERAQKSQNRSGDCYRDWFGGWRGLAKEPA
jgi:hypothetical protein